MEVGIRLFGVLEVTTPSRTTGVKDFPSRKAKILCQLLSLAGGRPVTKGRLIEELWGDKLPRDPGAALDHTVSLLRGVLRPDDGAHPLVHAAGTYRIDLTCADIDVVRFDGLVERARGEEGAVALATLMDAVAIADGDLLADEPYARWATAARSRYEQLVERTLIDVARRALILDDPELACRMAERARLESDVVVEQAYVLNVSALVALGRRDAARRLLDEVERRLRTDHASDVSDETARLRSILREPALMRRRVAGPIAVATRLRGPIAEAVFVGRDDVVAQIEEGIAGSDAGRPVVPMIVEGPGGVGRSRLLEHVGARFVGTVHRLTCLPTDSEHELLAATRLLVALSRSPIVIANISVASVFAGLVDALTADEPTLLVVDDLHFADPASKAVIASVAQHGIAVLASRLTGAVEVVTQGAEPSERIVRLGPLTPDDLDRLPLEGAWNETGGHPGLLGICLDAHRRQVGGGGGGDGDGDGAPGESRLDDESIRAILRWIGPDGSLRRDVLATAATLRPCSIGRLAGALGLSSTMTMAATADAEDLDLVCVGVDGTVTFRSDLVRRVLEATLT